MSEEIETENSAAEVVEIEVDAAVLVNPGTENEQRGTVVADFGEMSGHAVDIGENHFADPARRYAVSLDSGELLFVDAESLALASPTQ